MTPEKEPSPLDQGRVLQEALRVKRLGVQHEEIMDEQKLLLTDPHPRTEGLITPERHAELRALEERAARQRRRPKK